MNGRRRLAAESRGGGVGGDSDERTGSLTPTQPVTRAIDTVVLGEADEQSRNGNDSTQEPRRHAQ